MTDGVPKITIQCSCGFQTAKLSFMEIVDHLVAQHGLDRREVVRALTDSFKEGHK